MTIGSDSIEITCGFCGEPKRLSESKQVNLLPLTPQERKTILKEKHVDSQLKEAFQCNDCALKGNNIHIYGQKKKEVESLNVETMEELMKKDSDNNDPYVRC
jgi:hypothetical protein